MILDYHQALPEVAEMQEAPSVAPHDFLVLLPRTPGRDPMNGAEPNMMSVSVEEWDRVTSTLVSLEDEYKALRWCMAIMLARMDNEVTITSVELAEAESDDILTMEQDPITKAWTLRRESALDREGSPE